MHLFPFGFAGGGLFFLIVAALNFAFIVLLVLLVVLGVRWLVRNSSNDRSPQPPAEDSALTTLRERYARGEIDATEFEERKRTLGA
jgi:putative membrane protein